MKQEIPPYYADLEFQPEQIQEIIKLMIETEGFRTLRQNRGFLFSRYRSVDIILPPLPNDSLGGAFDSMLESINLELEQNIQANKFGLYEARNIPAKTSRLIKTFNQLEGQAVTLEDGKRIKWADQLYVLHLDNESTSYRALFLVASQIAIGEEFRNAIVELVTRISSSS
jgi:hypothetical protein